MGLWIALTIHYTLRTTIRSHLNSILYLEDQRYSYWALVCAGSLFVSYAAMVLYTNSIQQDNLPEWSTRI